MNDTDRSSTGTVFLIRHGHIAWDGQKRYVGQSDVPLSQRGRAQAEALRRWFETISLNRVVASDLTRGVVLVAFPAITLFVLRL